MGLYTQLSVHLGAVSCVVSCRVVRAVPCRRGCVLRGKGLVGVGVPHRGICWEIERPGRRRFLSGDFGRCRELRTAAQCWPSSISSRLLHHRLRAADLPLDLLPGPASSFNGARLELPVRPRFLNHCCDPILAEGIRQLAVGVRVRQVTVGELVIESSTEQSVYVTQ